MKDTLLNESTIGYKASYALVRGGDGITRCAWCNMATDAMANEGTLEKHIDKHVEADKR